LSTIVTNREKSRRKSAVFQGSPWRTLGGFGLVLTLIGVGQLILYLYPAMAFGTPEWEFGASAQLLGALPLPTIGLAALFAAAAGSANRGGLIALAVVLSLLAIAVFAMLTLFWLVVPVALQAIPAHMREPIYQTMGRTTLSGVGFGILYLWAAGRAVRQVKRSNERLSNA
jgi:hypothetical protein